MREYEQIIEEAFKKGIGPDIGIPYNSQYLYEALGFRVGKAGIEAYIPYENPIPSSLEIFYNWPFPQYLKGVLYNFLIIRNSTISTDYVYSISDDNLTVTLLATLVWNTYGQGGRWSLVDYGKYAILTNGLVLIYYTVVNKVVVWNLSFDTDTIPLMTSLVNLNGQLIGGGITSADWYDCDESFLIWSQIGSANFTVDKSNEAGYRKDLYGGDVYDLKILSGSCIVLSSKGVSLLKPVSEPTTALATIGLSDVGIINRGAVAGNADRVIYVGKDYCLREITGRGLNELGYVHLLEQLAGEDIIVNERDDFYIGNSKKTFCLSNLGMTEIQQHPSTVWGGVDITYGLPDRIDHSYPKLSIWPFDHSFSGQKTNEMIEISGEGFIGAKAILDYKLNGLWLSGPAITMNNQNIASYVASANAFRYGVQFDSILSDFRINSLRARYKITDLRGVKGSYSQPFGQK